MNNYNQYYQTNNFQGQTGYIEQLLQLLRIVWDDDLVSKSDRDHLVELGFATQWDGFNIITEQGIQHLLELDMIHP